MDAWSLFKKGARGARALLASQAAAVKGALPPAKEELHDSEKQDLPVDEAIAIDSAATDEASVAVESAIAGEAVEASATDASVAEMPMAEETLVEPLAEGEAVEAPAAESSTVDGPADVDVEEAPADVQKAVETTTAGVLADMLPTLEESALEEAETAEADAAGQQEQKAAQASAPAGAKPADAKGKAKKGMPKHAAKRKGVNWRSKRVLIPIIVVSALVVLYLAGCAFFSFHVMPGTTVAGVDVSLKSRNGLAQTLSEQEDGYTLHASYQDFSVDVPGKQVSLTGDYDEAARRLIQEQRVSAWPVELFVPKEAGDLGLSYNEEAVVDIVTTAVDRYNENKRAPLSATLQYDDSIGRFAVVDEQPGTALSSESVSTAAGEALKRMDASCELTDEVIDQPALVADSDRMRAVLNDANRWFDLTIPLTLKGKEVTKVKSDLLAAWLHLNKDLSVSFDETKIKEWVDEELWKEVDYADSGGLNVLNTEKFAPQLINALENGEMKALELPMSYAEKYLPYGPNVDNSNWVSSFGRYIEVDKSEQIAVFYSEKGDVLWESEVVTGNELTGQDTPEGSFAIYAKESNYTLVGFDNDGDGLPDYEHDVSVWLPFVDTIGLHDATWRSEFGGYIYTYDGSNGCVNLPLSSAKALYDMTHVGEKVVVKS